MTSITAIAYFRSKIIPTHVPGVECTYSPMIIFWNGREIGLEIYLRITPYVPIYLYSPKAQSETFRPQLCSNLSGRFGIWMLFLGVLLIGRVNEMYRRKARDSSNLTLWIKGRFEINIHRNKPVAPPPPLHSVAIRIWRISRSGSR